MKVNRYRLVNRPFMKMIKSKISDTIVNSKKRIYNQKKKLEDSKSKIR